MSGVGTPACRAEAASEASVSRRLALLVAIDTEGDNQWDAGARRHQRFENIYALGRLHEFFERHGIRPTYVVTYPVATDARSAEVLRGLLSRGNCEIGAHHHVWETPPFDADDVDRHGYALSLPLDRFDAQLQSLTDAIHTAVGRRPVSYRSGRFGFSASHVSSLEQHGYLVESSVAPLFYEAHKGGPDFVGAPTSPYFLSYDDPTRAGSSAVLELPVSAALSRRVPAVLERWYGRMPKPYTTRRVLRWLRIAHVRWLRPSYSSAEDMIAVARQIVGRGDPMLNLLFHSSEAIAGTSPYTRTETELAAFFDRLGRFLTYATRDLGAKPMTFAEFRELWGQTGVRPQSMRICHVSPHLPPDQGANALLPAQLGQWSAADGSDVSYVSYEAAAPEPITGGVWRVPPRKRSSGFARTLRLDSLRHAKLVSTALDKAAGRADILHLHSNGLIIEAAASWARRRSLPFILTLYGTEIWHYRRRWPVDLFTRAYNTAAHVTLYSRRLQDRAKAIGLDRPSMSVVYPPVGDAFVPRDAAVRAALRAELGIAEPLVILNVKRLHELAGQKFLIDAFARLARSRADVRLIICGAGALRQDLERQARESGAADKITFTGLLPNDEIARYTAVADLFVLPSLLEALPTVAVEALASGTPVVSADHPGGLELNEIFGDDVRIVPKSDVHALRSAIDEALHERRRVTSSTLDLVQRHFSPAVIHLAYTGLYTQAAKGDMCQVTSNK